LQGATSEKALSPASRWAAIAGLGLGALLRAHDFDAHPLWIDEYGTSWVVAAENLAGVWDRALAIQGQSPLYYLVVRGFVDMLGDSSLALRLPSLFAGIGLLAVGYWMALRLFKDPRVALASLAALALDERLIFYSQSARPYALALFCACLSFGLYARLLVDPRFRVRIAWLLASAATYYLHYLFGVALLAQLLHSVLRHPHSMARLRVDAFGFALLAGLLSPGVLQLAALHARRHVLDWVPPSQEAWAGVQLALSFFDLRILGVIGAGLTLALLLERPRTLRIPRSGLAVSALWFGVPLFVVSLGSLWLGVNLLHPRYVAVIIPAVALLWGAALALPESPRWTVGLLGIFVIANILWGLLPMRDGNGVFDQWYRAQHWQSATLRLAEQSRAGDLVLYGTRFVESDAVTRGEAPSQVVDFVSWPVRAHLPDGASLRLRALPFHFSPGTLQPLLLEMQRSGARVWIIGLADAFAPLLPRAKRQLGLAVQSHEEHGNIHLLRLGRGAP
jgi:4-amino-4-deoxy-L-arabinose transferase-like glycosyltransferase